MFTFAIARTAIATAFMALIVTSCGTTLPAATSTSTPQRDVTKDVAAAKLACAKTRDYYKTLSAIDNKFEAAILTRVTKTLIDQLAVTADPILIDTAKQLETSLTQQNADPATIKRSVKKLLKYCDKKSL